MEIAWNMQMSMNDNSINARFRWHTRIRSRRDFHTFCNTDRLFLKKKYACQFVFPWKKIFSAIFDFHFRENPRFRDEFQALISYWLLVDTKILIRQAGEYATGNDSPTVGLIRKSVVGEHC